MNNTQPLVSVITPMFNAEPFIGVAIKSVQAQTYKNWEMLIVDNCSTDKSREIVRVYAEKDKRVRLITSEYNSGGPAKPRNAGIKNAAGKYLAFLDADDQWVESKLEKQVNFMEAHPGVFLLYSRCYWQKDNKVIRIVPHRWQLRAGRIFWDLFISDNFISCLTVMLRNAAKEKGYFFLEDKRLVAVEDFDLWLRIAKNENISYIEEPLAVHFIHDSNLSGDIRLYIYRYLRLTKKWWHLKYIHLLLLRYGLLLWRIPKYGVC